MEMKAKEQDSLGQKMFLQQLTLRAFTALLWKLLFQAQFPLMMVAFIIANRDRLQTSECQKN